jgi:cobalamin biosynthesis Mg chelatase CobN
MAETNGNPNIVIGSFARINGFFPSPRTFTDAFIAAYGSRIPLPLPPRLSNSQNQKEKEGKKKSTKSAKDRERARESSKERAKKSERASAREGEREKRASERKNATSRARRQESATRAGGNAAAYSTTQNIVVLILRFTLLVWILRIYDSRIFTFWISGSFFFLAIFLWRFF